jgi:hypothetical protein
LESHRAKPASGSSRVSILTAPPIVWRSSRCIPSITALTAIGAMEMRWMREKASNWPVSLAPRRVDSRAVSAIRFSRGSSTRPAISSSPPMIGVSRLLKSWAMPPVRRPTASIFCAWRSASSALSRSPTSA